MGCDAHAFISFQQINSLKDDGIKPEDYTGFIDDQGKNWSVSDYKDNDPPGAPSLIFCLTKPV